MRMAVLMGEKEVQVIRSVRIPIMALDLTFGAVPVRVILISAHLTV